MRWMKVLMAGVVREDKASRSMDYAILAAFVALSIAAAIQLFDIEPLLTRVSTGVQSALSSSR